MPTNDFIGFASAGSANIMSQADFAAAAEQMDGVQPGPASSALANKVLRQGANMASALGAIINDYGLDAFDDGDIATLKGNLKPTLWGVNTNTSASSAIINDYKLPNGIMIQAYYNVPSGALISNDYCQYAYTEAFIEQPTVLLMAMSATRDAYITNIYNDRVNFRVRASGTAIESRMCILAIGRWKA